MNKEEFERKWYNATDVAKDRYPETYYIEIGKKSFLRADGYYINKPSVSEGYVILVYKTVEIGTVSLSRIRDIS